MSINTHKKKNKTKFGQLWNTEAGMGMGPYLQVKLGTQVFSRKTWKIELLWRCLYWFILSHGKSYIKRYFCKNYVKKSTGGYCACHPFLMPFPWYFYSEFFWIEWQLFNLQWTYPFTPKMNKIIVEKWLTCNPRGSSPPTKKNPRTCFRSVAFGSYS